MAHLVRVFGRIEKMTPQEDGTVVVDGIASTETRDSQGEIVKADAMRAALPAYMKFGNVREMHQAIAAGKAIACSVDDAGVTHISAHVVDASSCKKVLAGVLQGFSIGGSVPPGGRNKLDSNIIEQINLSEISLVDRPANPDATFQLVKMDLPVDPVVVEVEKALEAAAPAKPPPVIVPDPPVVTTAAPAKEAEKAAPTPEVKKGMYQVGWAAELCSSIDTLAQSTMFEAEMEGDLSPIPARIKSVCGEMCSILRDMVVEETAEMMGASPSAELMEMAETPGSLKKSVKFAERVKDVFAAIKGETEKGGKKFSASTAKAMGDIHAKIDKCHADLKMCSDAMHATGYADAENKDEDVSMAAESGDLQKRAVDAETLAKNAADLAKRAVDERNAIATQLAKTNAELAAANQALALRKGALKSVAVAKGDEGTAVAVKVESNDPVELTKSIHAAGGRRVI